MEGGGENHKTDFIDINVNPDSLDGATVFHIVVDVIGFILFMHQQIPSVIDDMALEFNELQAEYTNLESMLATNELKAPATKRKQAGRRREIKLKIKRQEKFMACISNLKTSLQSLISEVPDIQKISLVLGPSPLRPLHVYELNFTPRTSVSGDFSRTKLAESLSRKIIRSMISKGAGSDSCPGPTKLLLFVKAPSCLNLPLHFLPKRELRYNKKVIPFRLRFLCKSGEIEKHNECCSSTNLIWFQYRYTVKGLSFWTPPPEE